MRKCNCSGDCQPQVGALTRRDFIELVGAGVGGALMAGGSAFASFEMPRSELEQWQQQILRPASPRVYFSGKHTDARMHLGGIGTGNIEIGADGQLTNWQLFNTLRDGHVPFYFAAKSGSTAKLLQTAGGPEWPRIERIEMTGEYPVATLRFKDDALPVQIELEAFSPFEALNADVSSIPLLMFRFRIYNPAETAQEVSLGAFLTNPVGYDATGEIRGLSHPNFGANVNEFIHENETAGLVLRANAGREPSIDRALCFYVPSHLSGLKLISYDRPEKLRLELLNNEELSTNELKAANQAVLWLDEAGVEMSAPSLRSARRFVEAGGTLVFSGRAMPLLTAYATATGGRSLTEIDLRPDIVFEDFENGYDKWRGEGSAFGSEPAQGTLTNQQRVSGFAGRGLVNSFLQGDRTTGKLTSQTFKIERNFIRFLIGGGHYDTTQIRLVIGNEVVRSKSGSGKEHLEPAFWEVREFFAQSARIEIIDDQTDGWGHVNVDQIVFCDWPGDHELLETLDQLMPIRFSSVQEVKSNESDLVRVSFQDRKLRANASESRTKKGLTIFSRTMGKGRVVLAAGQIMNAAQIQSSEARQAAYWTLCEIAGVSYTELKGHSIRAPGFGTLALATRTGDVTGLTDFADWSEAWEQFSTRGKFARLEAGKADSPTPSGRTVNGALASTVSVPPGGTVEVPFFFTWHYPNSYFSETGEWMGCHYATRWTDAHAVLRDAVTKYDTLRTRTERFRRTFYASTLPYWMLDCITANIGIIRHVGVVFRTANGDVYGWEGSNGCCTPTCTHVWGYEQSVARLFPELEKEMRRIDFKHQQNPDGGINNRTSVPSPPYPTGEHPFADGHASCILKAYREALNSTDDAFFKEYWPNVKRAVEYLIQRDTQGSGGKPSGVLRDDQWNTYDEALHGVTTFISGYYLAALRAGEEWARRMGDSSTAERFHDIFVTGQKQLVELCWNGEYFQQHLPDYMGRSGEVGPGCMADQLIGQWWAHQLGLGYILPKDKVVASLRSIFKYNWKSDLTGWRHSPRAFAGVKDKGLIICTWPKGGRPTNVMLYSDEVWTGIEYQVAAHMIYEDLIAEGFSIVKGARERYDGIPRPPMGRNPWSEIECGGHYARAMSSWSLLLAVSGFECDGPRGILRFNPRHEANNFKCFFCATDGWGSFAQMMEAGRQKAAITVKSGYLGVNTLQLRIVGDSKPREVKVFVGGKPRPVNFHVATESVEIRFGNEKLVLNEGQELMITLI